MLVYYCNGLRELTRICLLWTSVRV